MAQRRRPGGRSESPGSKSSRSSDSTSKSTEDLEQFEASVEAKRATPSDVDAMGQDKRRQVVGHSYGPTRRSQIMFFVAVAAVAAVIIGGWLILVSIFDKPPTHFKDTAPWSTAATSPELAAHQNAPPVAPAPCAAGQPVSDPGPEPVRSPRRRTRIRAPPRGARATSRASQTPSSPATISALRPAQPGSVRSSVSKVTGMRQVSPALSTISAPAASSAGSTDPSAS